MSLFAELQRRRVFRALVGYGIGAFAVLQIIEPIMHGFHWPDAVLSYVVAALAVGFPIVVSLAWIFDVNAGRIERTEPTPGLRGARLAVVLVGIGVLAAAPGTIWYFFVRAKPSQPAPVAGAAATTPSIAVLPFVNLSSDKEQEYFSDGIAEEILNALVQVEGLRVAGRSSSFAFKGKNLRVEDVGRDLHVSAVLEGSVRKAVRRVRITAQLVGVSDGFHIWSQSYDRDLTDVFAVQDEIARAVVAALKVKLLPGHEPSAREHLATNPDAYSQYLIGRQLFHLGSPESYRRAVEAYEGALAIDPKYAPAWAGLAIAANYASNFALSGEEFQRNVRRSREAGDKAIQFDPGLAAGYAARGYVRAMLQHDWPGARQDLDRAVALDPRDAEIHRLHGTFLLLPLGRLKEAIENLRLATELDPGAPLCWNALGLVYEYDGQYGNARAALGEALRLNPGQSFAALNLVKTLLIDGDASRALEVASSTLEPGRRLTGLALAHHALGHVGEERKALDELVARYADRIPYQIADVFAWRGDREKALDWLERSLTLLDREIVSIKADPLLTSLRSDPRFTSLLKKMNLPLD